MIATPIAAAPPLQIAGDAPPATGDATPEAVTPFAALLALLGISVGGEAPATPETSTDSETDEDAPQPAFDEAKLSEAIGSGLAAVLALAAKPAEAAPPAPAATASAGPTALAAFVPKTDAITPPPLAEAALPPTPAASPKATNPTSIAAMIPAAPGTVLKDAGSEAPTPPTLDAPPRDGADTAETEFAALAPSLLTAAASPSPAALSGLAPAPAIALSPVRTETTAQGQSTPADIGIQHQLDLAHDGAWLDRLARDIARTANHDAQLRFQLNPEHLGSLRVELSSGAEGAAIRLTADTDAARAILIDAQPRLLAEARAQGLRISEAHVDLGGQGGNQRRQGEDQQPFIRTALAAEPASESPRTAAERYA